MVGFELRGSLSTLHSSRSLDEFVQMSIEEVASNGHVHFIKWVLVKGICVILNVSDAIVKEQHYGKKESDSCALLHL